MMRVHYVTRFQFVFMHYFGICLRVSSCVGVYVVIMCGCLCRVSCVGGDVYFSGGVVVLD